MEWLLNLDYELFYSINGKWTNPVFDVLLPLFRDKYFWIPLYIILIAFLIYKLRLKAIPVIIFGILTVALTDQTSSTLVKSWFSRLRPCNDPLMLEQVRLLVNCGPGFSFTSSHAANHFGIALFLGLLFKPLKQWLLPIFLFWAFAVAYSQVYVGVHYPLDIIGGAGLGMALGGITFYIMKQTSGNPFG